MNLLGFFLNSSEVLVYLFEHIFYRLLIDTSDPVYVFGTWFCIQLDSCNSGTILTSVTLFLHHQMQFVQTVKGSSIFFVIVFQGF